MWSDLTKPLSIIAITLVLFAALVFGMTTLTQNGGGAWGFDNSIPPERAAQASFENGDFRLLGIRLLNQGKPRQQLILGASCWPESRNTIEYEVDYSLQTNPEKGAHTERAEYASRYNAYLAAQIVEVGRECKIWR